MKNVTQILILVVLVIISVQLYLISNEIQVSNNFLHGLSQDTVQVEDAAQAIQTEDGIICKLSGGCTGMPANP